METVMRLKTHWATARATQVLSFVTLSLVVSSVHAQSTPSLDQPPTWTPGASEATGATPSTTTGSPTGASAADGVDWTARVGRGVTVRTRDERFELTLRARVQTRFTTEIALQPTAGADQIRAEFAVRRARLTLAGHVWTRRVQYYIQLGVSPQDMEPDLLVPLRDASVAVEAHSALSIRMGQMKVPFSRQRVISSSSLQYPDRTIVNAELNLDRDIGLQLYSQNLLAHRLGYQVGVFGGGGRNRPNLDSGLLYVARINVQPFGRFEDSDVEGDFKRTGPRLSIGLGAALNQRTNRSLSTTGSTYRLGRYDYWHAEADLLFKWAGFSLQGEAILRLADRPGTLGTPVPMAATPVEYSRSAWGYMGQLAYMLPSHFEFGARWAHVIPIALGNPAMGVLAQDPGFLENAEVGAVVSYYAIEHALKLQLDGLYNFAPATPEAGRAQIRLQGQVHF